MSANVIRIFEGVSSYIHELRELLESQGTVDAAPLDGKVQHLAQQISELPLEERLAYHPQLDQLQEALTVFEAELQDRKEALRIQLSTVGQHKQAHVAYRVREEADKKA